MNDILIQWTVGGETFVIGHYSGRYAISQVEENEGDSGVEVHFIPYASFERYEDAKHFAYILLHMQKE